MKQKQYAGRIQNLKGGYIKAGYENVKISEVKDYFLVHGKNYAMPNVFRELSDIEQHIERLPSEKAKKNTVIIPFSLADESELYDVLYEKTKEKSNVVDRPTEWAVLAILKRYRQLYYNDGKVSELMPGEVK
jgi:hypothetical protein